MIARLLGWPEAHSTFDVPPPVPATGPVSMHLEQQHPRLRVSWQEYANLITDERRWWWSWKITSPFGEVLDEGRAQTHAEALAVGLAALEAATVAGSPA